MRRGIRLVSAVALVASACIPFGAVSVQAGENDGENPIAECLSKMENPRLAAQFLIDESKSLLDSDPLDKRVDALNTALTALSFNLMDPGGSKKEKALQIDVRLVGFAKKFENHGSEWVSLKKDDNSALFKAAEEFGERDQQGFTNYEAGLIGAEESFVEYDRRHDEVSCKVLIWLTDGNLDLDNASGSTGPEDKQKKSICGAGGVVDRLRSQQIFVVGLGLNSNAAKKQDFSLMSQMVSGGCGERDPIGRFTEVGTADGLIQEMFRNLLPGVVDKTVPCLGEEEDPNCREVRFSVRPPLSRINVLVGLTAEIESALVIDPDGRQVRIADGGEAIAVQEGFVTAEPSFKLSTVLNLDVHAEPGQWRIQFRGPGAKNALVMSIFFSDVIVKIEKLPVRIDRRNPEPILVSLGKLGMDGLEEVDAEGTQIDFDTPPTLKAQLALGTSLIDGQVNVVDDINGMFEVRFNISQLLSAPSNGILTLTPVAILSGHEINFTPRTEKVSLKLGNGFPSVKDVTASDIDGTGTSKVSITLEGPEEGTGIARVLPKEFEAMEVPAGQDLKAVSAKSLSDKDIDIEAKRSKTIFFEVSPSFKANGHFKGQVVIEFENAVGEKQKQAVAFEFNMTKPFDTGRFLWALIIMLITFVMVQGAIIFFAADRLSRIAKVPSETYYARFRARINSSGSLDLLSQTQWVDVFKFATNPVPRSVSGKQRAEFGGFVVFGSRLQGLKWLIAGGDAALNVQWPGNTVVGARSSQSPSDENGKIAAALSGQWAIAVSPAVARSLVENSDDEAGTFVDHLTGEVKSFVKDDSIEAEFIYFVPDFDGLRADSLIEELVQDLSSSPLRDLIASAGKASIAATSKSGSVVPEGIDTPSAPSTPGRSSIEDEYG